MNGSGFPPVMSRAERRHTGSKGFRKTWVWIVVAIVALAGIFIYAQHRGPNVDYAKYNYTDALYARANATVTITEYSDFQCPACQAAEPSVHAVRESFPDVRMVYMEYPLRTIHPLAEGAAEAAECARQQDRFWAYHDVLFDTHLLQPAQLREHAVGLGLDMTAWDQCMQSGAGATAVQQDVLQGDGLNIIGTPTFFINGVEFNGRTVDEFQTAIQQAEANATG